jgi:WD40 repeat protein
VLHATLAGSPPFEGAGPALLYKILTGAPAPLRAQAPDVPAELERLVGRLLEKKPEARPPSAESVARELDAILAAKEPEPAARSPWLFVLPFAAAAVFAAVLFPDARSPGPRPSPAASPGATSPSPRATASGKLGVLRTVGSRAWKHSEPVYALALAGRTLVSGGADACLVVADAATGDEREVLAGNTGRIVSVVILERRQTVIAGTTDGELLEWRLGSGAPPRHLERKDWAKAEIGALSADDDERFLLVGENDGVVRKLEIASGDVRVLREGGLPIRSVFEDSKAGSIAVEDSTTTPILRWEPVLGAQSSIPRRGAHEEGYVARLGIRDDGRLLVAILGGRVFAWNLMGGAPERYESPELHALVFVAGGRDAVATDTKGNVRRWELATGHVRWASTPGTACSITTIASSPSGDVVVAGFENALFKLSNGAVERTQGPASYVTSVAVDWERGVVVSGSVDGTARRWRLDDGTLLGANADAEAALPVAHVSIAPRTRRIAVTRSGPQSGVVTLWDPAAGPSEEPRRLEGYRAAWFAAAERELVTARSSFVIATKLDRAYEQVAVGQQADAITSLVVDPDGHTVFTGGKGTVGIWDVEKPAPEGPAGPAYVFPIATDRDVVGLARVVGTTTLLAAAEGYQREPSAVFRIDMGSRSCREAFRGRGAAKALVSDPVGKLVAFATDEGSVEVRDAATDALLGELRLADVHDFGTALALSAERKLLIVGTARGVLLWVDLSSLRRS